jgi:hypothetical protein
MQPETMPETEPLPDHDNPYDRLNPPQPQNDGRRFMENYVPALESMHARMAARTMARLAQVEGDKPSNPMELLDSLLDQMKDMLHVENLARVPTLLTLQTHVLDMAFHHMLGDALDGASKKELIQIALRCQKQCREVVRELDQHQARKTPKLPKPRKNRQTDYYEDGFYR